MRQVSVLSNRVYVVVIEDEVAENDVQLFSEVGDAVRYAHHMARALAKDPRDVQEHEMPPEMEAVGYVFSAVYPTGSAVVMRRWVNEKLQSLADIIKERLREEVAKW